MEIENSVSKEQLEECAKYIDYCRKETAVRLVGQTEIVDGILTALIAGGHILLEVWQRLWQSALLRKFRGWNSRGFSLRPTFCLPMLREP